MVRAEGYTKDVSRKGCLAVMPHPFAVGQKVRVTNLAIARLVTRTFCPTAKGCGITARQPFRLTSFVYPSARTTFPSSVHSIATRTRELSRQA